MSGNACLCFQGGVNKVFCLATEASNCKCLFALLWYKSSSNLFFISKEKWKIFLKIWDDQMTYSFPENKIFISSEVVFMAADHMGVPEKKKKKNHPQELPVCWCTGQWLEHFLWLDWNFSFPAKMLVLELSQRTREPSGFTVGRGGAVLLASPCIGVHYMQGYAFCGRDQGSVSKLD